MSSSDSIHLSKPPKLDGKGGTAFVIWDIKFRSWSKVKGNSESLIPSFDSKLSIKQYSVIDNTDLSLKAQGITRKQNGLEIDAPVQSMSDTDNFHHILQNMKEDASWPSGKAWKTWRNIQKHYQPADDTTARDVTSALCKIKLKKHDNPVKILNDISAIEIRYKKTLYEERMIEIVLSHTRDDYAQVIDVADSVARINSLGAHDVTTLELCIAMQKLWWIAGHNDIKEEDDDNEDDSKLLETLLGAVKQKQSTNKKMIPLQQDRPYVIAMFLQERERRVRKGRCGNWDKS